jgi:DNA processing protein
VDTVAPGTEALSPADHGSDRRETDTELQELAAALALAAAPRLGPVSLRELIDESGSARELLRRARSSRPPFSATVRRRLAGVPPAPVEQVRKLANRGIRLLAYGSDGYPERLNHLYDPPVLLYLRGSLDLGDRRTRGIVAIVGTRRATPYGRRMAREIATGLAEAGWAVVSGMARGIDGEAHAAALDAGGATIGVLGSGLDFAYPAVHRPLYRRMVRSGLLVSEFAPATPPAPGLFPRRNRIIAALAKAVVVVQAPARSGALITADHALDLGRDVLAVPGPVGLEPSVGTHRLLHDGAALATCAADVLEEVMGPNGGAISGQPESRQSGGESEQEPEVRLGRSARRVLERLSTGPANADELVRASTRPVPEALAMLGGLELEGILQRQGDGRYVLSSHDRRAVDRELERFPS